MNDSSNELQGHLEVYDSITYVPTLTSNTATDHTVSLGIQYKNQNSEKHLGKHNVVGILLEHNYVHCLIFSTADRPTRKNNPNRKNWVPSSTVFSPPVQIAGWARMHRFRSVCLLYGIRPKVGENNSYLGI